MQNQALCRVLREDYALRSGLRSLLTSRFLFHQPAGGPMSGAGLLELRLVHRTFCDGNRATRVEAASLGRVERAWHVTLQNGALALDVRVRDGNGGHQG